MKDSEMIRSALSAGVVCGLGLCVYLLFFVTMPDSSRDIILVVIGWVGATFKDVYAYYFGSSSGSKRKTEIMKESAECDTSSLPSS